jgi:hypothetical protein
MKELKKKKALIRWGFAEKEPFHQLREGIGFKINSKENKISW